MPVPYSLSGQMLPMPGDEQHDLHRVAVLAQERVPARLGRRFGELVRPVAREPRRHLGRGEPGLRIDAERGRHLVARQRVPGVRGSVRCCPRLRHGSVNPSRRSAVSSSRLPGGAASASRAGVLPRNHEREDDEQIGRGRRALRAIIQTGRCRRARSRHHRDAGPASTATATHVGIERTGGSA